MADEVRKFQQPSLTDKLRGMSEKMAQTEFEFQMQPHLIDYLRALGILSSGSSVTSKPLNPTSSPYGQHDPAAGNIFATFFSRSPSRAGILGHEFGHEGVSQVDMNVGGRRVGYNLEEAMVKLADMKSPDQTVREDAAYYLDRLNDDELRLVAKYYHLYNKDARKLYDPLQSPARLP